MKKHTLFVVILVLLASACAEPAHAESMLSRWRDKFFSKEKKAQENDSVAPVKTKAAVEVPVQDYPKPAAIAKAKKKVKPVKVLAVRESREEAKQGGGGGGSRFVPENPNLYIPRIANSTLVKVERPPRNPNDLIPRRAPANPNRRE